MNKATQLRHDLHRHPELSGREERTAERIERFFKPFRPDETFTGLGGHGLAFGFGGVLTLQQRQGQVVARFSKGWEQGNGLVKAIVIKSRI